MRAPKGHRRTVKIKIIHRRNVRLGFTTDVPHTVWFTAIASLRFVSSQDVRKENSTPTMHSVPVAIHVVVESQFFVLLDIPTGEDAHAYVAPDSPFRNIAIWAAAMVGEAPDASAFSGVYELRNQKVVSSELRKGEGQTSSFWSIIK